MIGPARGEVWLVDLNPTRGREQAGRRPVLVVSVDTFNRGPADLVVILPITSRQKGIASHVAIDPPEGGVKSTGSPPSTLETVKTTWLILPVAPVAGATAVTVPLSSTVLCASLSPE